MASMASPISQSSSSSTTSHRRLLVPSFLVPTPQSHTQQKISRPRSDSASHPIQAPLRIQWPFTDFKLHVVHNNIVLHGYRICAVEKWIIQRAPCTFLIVYTGDQTDKITVAATTPHPSLSSEEQSSTWDNLASGLRREGARPRQTEHGVILVTSLASFRSDYTVVHIPDGDFPMFRNQLYANINLLRIGCSGRSALTLNPPSDPTKDRFINVYHFKDNIRPHDSFVPTVLELGRVIQCSLSFFGCYSLSSEDQDGLLCDVTVAGLEQWVDTVCWPYTNIGSTDRIADPSIVAALLSLVLTVRNKLYTIGYSQKQIPKDPFIHPRQFMRIVSAFANQRANQLRSQDSTGSSSSPQQPTSTSPHPVTATPPTLTDALLRRIDTVFDKVRSSESYKVHRVLLNKLDDITSVTTSAFASSSARGRGGREHAPSLSLTSLASAVTGTSVDGAIEVTNDLAAFVLKVNLMRGKDGAPSLRYLWSGRLDQLDRAKAEAAGSDVEKDRDGVRERSGGERSDGRSSDEEEGEGLGALPWSGRVHKKIEGWKVYAKAKAKRSSVDISRDKSLHASDRSVNAISLPAVVVSRDPEELALPSSGQASPISPSTSMIALGGVSPHASTYTIDDAEFFRRLQNFNQKHPQPPLSPFRHRARARARAGSIAGPICWSDPVSMEELVPSGITNEENYPYMLMNGSSPYQAIGEDVARNASISNGIQTTRLWDSSMEDSDVEDVWGKRKREKQRNEFACRLKRWSSFDDKALYKLSDCLNPAQMQIDVDLCAQCLIMHRRRFHVEAIVRALQAVLETASSSNDALKSVLETHKAAIHALDTQCAHLAGDVDQARYDTDAITLETNALRYEAGGYDVPELWQMARVPRHRVFAIRERVFGTGFARATSATAGLGAHAHTNGDGVRKKRGAHGRFNRVQRTLDRRERFVDWLGRTESEVDEESELPEVMPGMTDMGASTISLAESDGVTISTPGIGVDSNVQGYVGSYATLGRLSAGGGGWLLTMFSKWGSVLGVGGGTVGTEAASTSGSATANGPTMIGDPDKEAPPSGSDIPFDGEKEKGSSPDLREGPSSEALGLDTVAKKLPLPPPTLPSNTYLARPQADVKPLAFDGTSAIAKLDTIAEEGSSDFSHRSSTPTLTFNSGQ